MAKTIHVYSSEGGWAVQKLGTRAEIFRTKKAAVGAAVTRAKKRKAAQVVVHSKLKGIQEVRTFGTMRKIQEPRGKSPNAARIRRAVSEVILARVRASSPSEPPAKK